MLNKKIVFSTIFLTAFALLFWRVGGVLAQVPQPVALKIVIDQTQTALEVKEVILAETNPSDYKLNLPKNYYTIEMRGADGKALFSGKIAHTVVSEDIPSEDTGGGEPPKSQKLQFLTLYLPYDSSVTTVLFLTEGGKKILTVNLDKYHLLPPNSSTNRMDKSNKNNVIGLGVLIAALICLVIGWWWIMRRNKSV